jgi:hypothetical protein
MEMPVVAKYARHPVETYTDALRILARSNDVDRSKLIKRNIDLCLQGSERTRLLDGLQSAINNEESEKREGEDWSIAREYVKSLLAKLSGAS